MHRAILLFCVLVTGVPAFGQELFGVGAAADRSASTRPSTRPARWVKRNPINIVDLVLQTDSVEEWADGSLHNANLLADAPARIVLGFNTTRYPRVGTWTGPEIKTAFAFKELLATFNPTTPPNTGAMIEVRVRQGEKWSPWLYVQQWGRILTPPERLMRFEGGEVDCDEIVLTSPADAYQVRISLMSFECDAKITPAVRRLSVCYSGVVDDAEKRNKLAPATQPTNWARDLRVPFRGQGDYKNPKVLWGLICSPTSVSMVMEYCGINRTTEENALAIYDPVNNMFGNWGRAVARAGEMGLDAWLMRFRNWEQVKAQVAEGQPVIASIKFGKGEVRGFLYESTGGHLIVIRGFTPDGNVIVNDPARREKGGGVIYPAAEFSKAWFDNGGVGYIIRPAGGFPNGIGMGAMAATQPATREATAAGGAR